jgi:hypothetical protein
MELSGQLHARGKEQRLGEYAALDDVERRNSLQP